VARLTVSDRAHQGVYEDKGGPELERVLKAWISQKVPLILTTGGTGPAPRDITPEATLAVLEKQLPGLSEAQRLTSFSVAPTSILSRAVAGVEVRA
jgi:molybdopterin adenylyltransferase